MKSFLYSIKSIEKQYNTGELPVLVVCSDKESYICKYMRSSSAAYKLACEFIGATLIKLWEIPSPKMNLVKIKREHWGEGIITTRNLSAPAIGYRMLDGVIDITPTTCSLVSKSNNLLKQLLNIALFDFWIANEDRTYNNANLLYDVCHEILISIDYGGILNTSTFEYFLSQLTSTDTILYADLFHHLIQNVSHKDIWNYVNTVLSDSYKTRIKRCQDAIGCDAITQDIPPEWNLSNDLLKEKLQQLINPLWVNEVWENFVECLKENLGYE